MSSRECPRCGSHAFERRHLPTVLRPVRLVRPAFRAYRCLDCDRTWYVATKRQEQNGAASQH